MAMSSLFLALVLYPALEEWLFRSVLLQEADRRWPQRHGWRTNLAVSLLFGLAHTVVWPVGHAVAVVVPSLLFGWLWQRYKRLWICIVVHGLCNAVPYFFAAPG